MKNNLNQAINIEKMNEFVTRIHLPGNVFAYYIEGTKQGLLVDTGFGCCDLRSTVETISTKPYSVLLTHGHLDHAGGAGQFPSVWLHPDDLELAKIHTDKTLRYESLKADYPDLTIDQMIEAKSADEYLTVRDGQIFDLGDIQVIGILLPGHTKGSLVLFLPELKTMLFGDAVNSAVFMQLEESLPIAQYQQNLMKFEQAYGGDYQTLLFSHPHNFGQTELVPEMIQLCQEVLDNPKSGIVLSQDSDNIRMAKPADDQSRRLDGKTANMVYKII